MPDTTALLITWVQTVTGLPAAQISADIPDPIPTDFVQVRRLGGSGLPPVRDQPLIQFSSWATSDRLAMVRLEEIRTALWTLPGSTTLGITVYAVDDSSGPTSTTDPNTGRRFAFMRNTITVRADDIAHQFS